MIQDNENLHLTKLSIRKIERILNSNKNSKLNNKKKNKSQNVGNRHQL